MSWPILRWDSGCLSNRLHSMCKVDWLILRWDSCRSIYYSHPRTLSKVDWHYYGGILDASTTSLSKGSKITKISSLCILKMFPRATSVGFSFSGLTAGVELSAAPVKARFGIWHSHPFRAVKSSRNVSVSGTRSPPGWDHERAVR